MASLLPSGKQQFTNSAGAPLVGGKLYTYDAGTTMPRPTFADAAGTIPNTNPVILDARGEATVFWSGTYKAALKDASDATIWTVDGVAGPDVLDSTLRTELAGTPGAALVGYSTRTVAGKLAEQRSIEDHGAMPATAFAAAAAAVQGQGGGCFVAGAYAYAPAGPMKIVGDFGTGLVYDARRSCVTAPDTATDAYFVGNEVGNIASSYFNKYTLRNLAATGQGKTGTACGYRQQAAADINVDGGHFYNFSVGMYLHGALTSDYRGITVRNNGIGVKAEMFDDGAGGLNSFAPNANSFYGLRCYHNDIGAQYLYNPSGVANWIGSNFEDNNSGGNDADGKKVVEMANAGHHNFIGCHFEANKGNYGIHYTGADSGKNLLLLGCEVIDAVHTNLYIGMGRLTSVGSRITNTVSTRDIHVNTGARATLIDTEGVLSGDMSSVLCLRDGRIGFGTQPINTSPLVDMQEASIVASSNIAMNWRADTAQFRWQNAAGTRIGYLQTSAAGDHILNNDNAAGGWSLRANNANRLYIGRSGAASIEPGADNTITLGSASFRFSVIYAATGTINTSDERAKQDIEAVPDEWLDAWADVQWARYRMRDAVAVKGTSARWHVGVIAQRVEQAFAARGLDARAIGLLCWDEWPAQPDVLGDDGSVVQAAMPAGERYGVRYEEALALEAALMRRTTERLERRLAALEIA